MNNNMGPALYVHIPFCRGKCRYCGFYSEPLQNQNINLFISALLKDLSGYDIHSPFNTIYIGGGSPSVLPRENLFSFIEQIVSRWGVRTEFTVEVNPSQVDGDFLQTLCDLGVNRLSIGAQSFDPAILKFLGRGHGSSDIVNAVKLAREGGFENISLDLIFAIPGSDINIWRTDLQSAIDLGVEHISAYSLTYEEDTPLKTDLDAGLVTSMDEQTDCEMYELAIDMLGLAGINQYEISNFARDGFQCKHNLTYWANEPYVGIGPAAGGCWEGRRTLNVADVKDYIKRIEAGQSVFAMQEVVSGVDRACETAVLNLRRISGINLAEFKEATGYDAMSLFGKVIEKNCQSGLLQIEHGSAFLTRKALPIADLVLCDFSAI
ncbi:MAG TPA: radical SAM family heme chaperone HemW [Sedimentisphaerales bacterium]|nr:radical SAM family heme chaperone HemW [Sedimentisphaerales bacterium]